ncbi:hypothetical protein [Siphonobacter sp. SORGH_AS_0500]|uniref:hypothetical protein n=1 Tax=Siphonobacter sp. SORGH_AS_0500 TaxID=1864824 RepID=UPI00285C9860|nr:hypothetical protein [Siphonobacter sp. SORGH_AS_0500]MDR6196174.1 hypothetical protein [Siphonobacter sp. SORGH_AS_0500]
MDNQEKHPFLTDAFYAWDYETISVLNELISQKLHTTNDHYGSGEFLFLSVKDCPETREIVSRVISDIDQYQKAIEGMYWEPEKGSIGMLGLYEMHSKYFGARQTIMWHEESKSFMSCAAFYSDDDSEEEYDIESLL